MIEWFIIFCCWIVSFFFNGIESGLLSIDPVRFRQNLKRGVPAARRLDRLLKHPERLLATVLLCTNAADILALLLLTRQLVRSFGYAGYFFSLVIALPVYLFLLSVLPKSLFRRFPFRALAQLAGVLEVASMLFSPLLEIGSRLGKLILPARAAKHARLFAAREELKQITTESERDWSWAPLPVSIAFLCFGRKINLLDWSTFSTSSWIKTETGRWAIMFAVL